jgi:probable rRNA maturation factor
MLTDTVLEDARWQQAELAALAESAARAALLHLGHDPAGHEIALLGCDDSRIAELNAAFRGTPRPTNVLSWPVEDLSNENAGAHPRRPAAGDPRNPHALGDIALAYDTCAREAAQQGTPLGAHVTHLVVHGVLHLLGYDHVRDGDATMMEGLEVEILGKLGLPDPYCRS